MIDLWLEAEKKEENVKSHFVWGVFSPCSFYKTFGFTWQFSEQKVSKKSEFLTFARMCNHYSKDVFTQKPVQIN